MITSMGTQHLKETKVPRETKQQGVKKSLSDNLFPNKIKANKQQSLKLHK